MPSVFTRDSRAVVLGTDECGQSGLVSSRCPVELPMLNGERAGPAAGRPFPHPSPMENLQVPMDTLEDTLSPAAPGQTLLRCVAGSKGNVKGAVEAGSLITDTGKGDVADVSPVSW